ncbi:MAG: phosphomethylpyrimidine synthase ThiC [Candidatus Omnitrophota bacterium]|nr:phosphomethylpyrimidine synthase ThiC [Candidatus Omnitrophota bacterium]
MTQLEAAKRKKITEKMRFVAEAEGLEPEFIREGVEAGAIVIPSNTSRREIKKYCAIGKGLRTKVNANIGSSLGHENINLEIKKLQVSVKAGADTVMDLSTGRNLKKIRNLILEKSQVPVGTVPVYEMSIANPGKYGETESIDKSGILACLENQAKEGVDFFTIHCGVTRETLKKLDAQKRLLDIVSRGGAFIARWIKKTGRENPFYEYFDDILEIAREYDITLSLGDGIRPGCIKDATDRAQIMELITLGELAKRARSAGVQVIIEGPGHIPIHQIKRNVEMAKSICDNAPFYVLGPIVTDIAAGYDHISGAIGGAIAAAYGADFLCYVTPSEHLRLPTLEDVKEGVISARIAAHASDIAKGIKNAQDTDDAISAARKKRDWKKQIELSIDPERARKYRKSSSPVDEDVCTMCDKYCSIKLFEEASASTGGR